MEIRRAMAAGAVGLALVASGVGCSKVADTVAEEAVERNSTCKDVDIDSGGSGLSGNCDDQEFDLNAGGEAELPDAWPADLALPEGAKIVLATDQAGQITVTAGLDGELGAVTDGIVAQLEGAGYTIEDETTTDNGGSASASVRATGPDHQALVAVTDTANAVDGNLTIIYTLSAPTTTTTTG